MITCARCKDCGQLATKEFKWVPAPGKPDEEIIQCRCGGTNWIFVEKFEQEITPDTYVMQKA